MSGYQTWDVTSFTQKPPWRADLQTSPLWTITSFNPSHRRAFLFSAQDHPCCTERECRQKKMRHKRRLPSSSHLLIAPERGFRRPLLCKRFTCLLSRLGTIQSCCEALLNRFLHYGCSLPWKDMQRDSERRETVTETPARAQLAQPWSCRHVLTALNPHKVRALPAPFCGYVLRA